MNKLKALWDAIIDILDPAADWVALLPIRLLMAYEFGKAGFTKLNGSNWFGRFQEDFLFPFNVVPVEISWFGFSLIILSIVAISGVHWPDEWNSLAELWEGYRVTAKDGSGNFRIPLLFIAMLFPLMFAGGGKLSLDYVLAKKLK
jgi:putative oxidoreductase